MSAKDYILGNISDNSVVAVVVTYHPVMELLEQLLSILVPQVAKIVVVDNGSETDLTILRNQQQFHDLEIINWGENKGIAAAHCMGIQRARELNAEFVLLMDQDSIPAPDMVSHLLTAMRDLSQQGVRVAAVGPQYKDVRNSEHPSFVRVNGLKVDKLVCQSSAEIVESDILISSGCLIPLNVLADVGKPLKELFIDQVDLEWCFRAKSCGYLLFGVCRAVLYHSLGETPREFCGRKFLHHGPLRHYYIFRNAVWLLFKKYVPWGWKFLFVRMLLVRFLVYICLVSPRPAFLKMMVKGVIHGLIGRLGKL